MLPWVPSPAPTHCQVTSLDVTVQFSGPIPSLNTSFWHAPCCCYIIFFQLHWGITHHISHTPLCYSNQRPAAKPLLPNCRKKLEGKCKKVRKGTGIFCSSLKLVSFHASSLCMGLYLYCKLCTNNVTLTSLQTAVSTARSDGNEHNLVGKNETYMSNCITRDSFPRWYISIRLFFGHNSSLMKMVIEL